METTPDWIKLCVRRFLLKASNYALELTGHGVCAVRPNPDQLLPPMRTDNIKKAPREVKHILAGVLFEHRDGHEMKVVEFAVDVNTNAVVEIRFAVMGRPVTCQREGPGRSVLLRIEDGCNKFDTVCEDDSRKPS